MTQAPSNSVILPTFSRRACSLTVALGLFLTMPMPANTAAPEPNTVVIDSGLVKGVRSRDMITYRGIPYAAPPVGPRRWQPPEPPPALAGVHDATRFGNRCPQNGASGVFARPSMSEDCLYLNVFTPAEPGSGKPVLVWIHGGGLFSGESDDYNPVQLVKQGSMIVVTINYRLGQLGYFPRVAKNGHRLPANYGLLDQQFALRWVQRNIKAFGGDPDNVTIAGESAGGESVYALLASPDAAGLFHRAIAQSGGYTPNTPDLHDMSTKSEEFASRAGCASMEYVCLQSLSVGDLLAAQHEGDTSLVVDGVTLPLALHAAFETGHFNRVPVLSGMNAHEMRWFSALDRLPGAPIPTLKDAIRSLSTMYGDRVSAILSRYPPDGQPDAISALAAPATDAEMACPQNTFDRLLSRWVPVYAYEFNDPTAPSYMPDTGFALGAAHTFELQYLFSGFHGATGSKRELNALQQRLSETMIAYWTQFAINGVPGNANGLGPTWPAFSVTEEATIALVSPTPIILNGYRARHHCDFWNN